MRILLLISSLLLLSLFSFSQTIPKKKKAIEEEKQKGEPNYFPQRIDYYNTWTERGAKVVPLGEVHLSAIAFSRYGNYPKTELNSQLLLFPFCPNFGFKHEWWGKNTIVATQHRAFYPTLGLNWLKSSGFKDQIPKSAKIPQLLTIRNELIVSRILNPHRNDCYVKTPYWILTGRLGMDFTLSEGGGNFPRLDYYFLYHRTASYHNNRKLYFLGAELDGYIYRNFNFSLNADYFSINFNGEWAIESQGKVHWHRNSKFSLSAGYKMYYLKADAGKQFLLTPTIDFVWKLNHRTRLQRGLFK